MPFKHKLSKRLALLWALAAAAMAACSEVGLNDPETTFIPESIRIDPPAGAVLSGAGAIASCDSRDDEQTAKLLDRIPGAVFTTGDNVHGDGSASDFANCYAWSQHKNRTRPAAGDMEYHTADAAGYFAYFGDPAGPAGKGYYSYDLDSWHVVVLNSNISMAAGSPQEQWLRADLTAHPAACTLAYWSHPRFSSYSTHVRAEVKPLWDALYEAGADLVLNGHYRLYERFAPQTPDGVADSAFGIRQITAGTGGQGVDAFDDPQPTSVVRQAGAFGVLMLGLEEGAYSWQFVGVPGEKFTDAGRATCHGLPGLAGGSIEIAPNADTLAVGDSLQFTATVNNSSGSASATPDVSWTSSDTTIATVSASGVARGRAPGSAAIVASSGGLSDSAAIAVIASSDTVPAPVSSLTIAPAAPSVAVSATMQLTATARDSAGNALAAPTVTWASGDKSIASVSSSGLLTGVATGTTSIVASSDGVSDTVTATVSDVPVASVTVAPSGASIEAGDSVQLSATAKDSGGTVLSGRAATWTSSAPAVATVSGAGLVEGIAEGTAQIIADVEGKKDTATVTVTPVPVASVTVTPAGASLTVGQTVQLTAAAKDASGTTLSGRTTTWTSSATGIASVDANGLVTGKTDGTAQIIASVEGKADTATVTVTPVPVAQVTVTPASADITVDGTVQLTAVAEDSSGAPLSGRSISWASSDPGVALVSTSGLVTGRAAGSVTITATSEGKSGSAAISVTGGTGSHAGYFVAPSGASGNDGSDTRPWPLAYALGGAGGRIQAGDTVWVRAGTYNAPFRSTLSGTAGAPIVVRAYPGERAIIDGATTTSDNFVVAGSYSVFWGLEFTNTNPSRYTSDATSHSYRADNVVNHGTHNKYINLIIHDGGVGFFTYPEYGNVEITGSILYNNGWDSSNRGHGHGLYLKNNTGPVVVQDNILFNQFGYGIHCYTNSGSGWLNGLWMEGNVSFDNGSLSTHGTSANGGNLGEPLANDMGWVNNILYFAPTLSGSNLVLGSGSGLTATGNYVVGGSGISIGSWSNATVTSNTVLQSLLSGLTSPTVIVRPNPYEAGRANVVVLNGSGQSAVTVSVASLAIGDRYVVHNVQDLWGPPVASGTYSGAITLPMTGVTPPVPVGMSSSRAPTTGPYFDVFLVTKP